MPGIERHRKALRGLLALGFLLATAKEARGLEPACTLAVPTVVGPEAVRSKEAYSISWTRVLKGLLGKNDYYLVERAADSAFTTDVLKLKTTRTSASLPGLPTGREVAFHRVLVQAACPGGGVALPSVSPVLAVRVSDSCAVPGAVALPAAAPEAPPAYTTYVLTWEAAPAVSAGSAAVKTRYRLRRIEGTEARDSVVDGTAAMFTDPPGEYRYQVRAEASCGAAGPWSPVRSVVVGPARNGSLLLVSEPLPFFAGGLSGQPAVRTFAVRNGGTDVLEIVASAPPGVVVTPAAFAIGPWETVSLTASSAVVPAPEAPVHLAVDLRSPSGSLRVLFDVAQPVSRAAVPVALSESELSFDEDGADLELVLENPGETPASIVTSIRADWLVLSDPSGGAWDRPLAPSERRPVAVAVDRSRRRADTGTEVGTVTVETFGLEGAAANVATLTAVDDGPPLVLTDAATPSAPAPKTRLLFASLPNAPDVQGAGRYTADLWLTNLDATAAIPVTLTLTPVGEASGTAMGRRTELTLSPGETRRYRNIVGKMMGRDGAASLEVRSSATTLSATVVAASTPNRVAARGARAAAPRAGGVAATGQYGFEMRPTSPGEGARASDPEYVVSGLAHDARRRTNLILTETSGVATGVTVEVFDLRGFPVEKNGVPVQIDLVVPASGALQLNDADIFPEAPLQAGPYARVSWQGTTSSGSVVPFATVIDNGTQDASLRVGVSTRALSPLAPEGPVPAAKRPTASSPLPFDGGPAPLLFPVAHATGVPVGSGEQPVWKTRVTLTNVNLDEQRIPKLAFLDQSGNAPVLPPIPVVLGPGQSGAIDDIVKELFLLPEGKSAWGGVYIAAVRRADGTWSEGWSDVDVQTETYTNDPAEPQRGDFMTGMEGYSYLHGYSSFQSNLGTVQIEGAETSSRFRTNLILQEVGGAPCTVVVGAYLPGSFVPLATAWLDVPPFGYISRELFRDVLGLDLRELVDVRVVIRQYAGDGVFMAFASKIDQVTGDPANIFLRPASAGTGR